MCQINLSDVSDHDKDNLLPKKGFLYFFVDSESDEPSFKVLYTDKDPDTVYEECNMGFDEIPYDLFTDYVMRFGEGESGKILEDSGDNITLLEYLPKSSECDVFNEYDSVRVIIPKDALSDLDFSKAFTETN